MSHVRIVRLSLLVGLGYVLVSPSSQARQDKDKDPVDTKSAGYFTISNMKTEGVPDAKVDDAKTKFLAFAQYNADVVSWTRRYSLLQDPTVELPQARTIDGILAELEG